VHVRGGRGLVSFPQAGPSPVSDVEKGRFFAYPFAYMPQSRRSDQPHHVALTVIVPFHRNLDQLRRCLAAVHAARHVATPLTAFVEVIVAADGPVDDPAHVAREFGATDVTIAGPRGPAVARNRAAAAASGTLLVFVDADVVMSERALSEFVRRFTTDPELGAAFGAYDEEPADPGFFSQCRNLAHSFVHQRSSREASTFWAGLGAIRADVFSAVGGFDERFARPSVEDIDLGYRVRAAGFPILLDATIQGKHLKRWTLRSSIVSDLFDRGIPWTQLMQRYGGMRNDLNVSIAYRMCVVVAYLMLGSVVAAARWPMAALAVVALAVALWLLDRSYYRFFVSRRGWWFTLRWFPFHVAHHLCNGISFAAGTTLSMLQRAGVTASGALPQSPWRGIISSDAVESRPTATQS